MRTCCGRSDGEPTNQAREGARRHASPQQSAPAAIYYNRLEYSVRFRLCYARARSSVGSPFAVANPPRRDDAAAPGQIPTRRAFLSLPQVRESCHQQLWGATPFRRGIA